MNGIPETASSIEIERASPNDAAGIWRVRTRAIQLSCRTHYSADDIALWSAAAMPADFGKVIADHEFVVARQNGEVVGFGFIDRGAARLEAIFVDPDRQKCGIGARILSALEDTARRAGLGSLSLSATLNAVAFYEQAGFKPQLRTKFHHPAGFELDCVTMEKRLDQNSAETSARAAQPEA